MGRARRTTGELLMTASAIVLLVGILVAVDPRVREQVGTIVRQPDANAAGVSKLVSDVGSTIMAAAHDQSIEHAPLLIFGVGAAVLTIFVLRM